jgi:vancomycin resistance protein YoaR
MVSPQPVARALCLSGIPEKRVIVVQGDSSPVSDQFDEQVFSPRPRSTSRRRGRSTSGSTFAEHRGAWIAAAAIAGILLLACVTDALASAGRIHPGVTVAGIALGGKSPADAIAALKAELPKKAASPVTVKYADKSWAVDAGEIGVSFDYAGLLDRAMSVGREKNIAASVAERFRSWFGGVSIAATATADPAKLNSKVDAIASDVDVAPQDAVLKVTPDDVTIKPATTGVATDRARLQSDLLGSFASDARTIQLHAATSQPKINDLAAKAAQTVVQGMVSAPVEVTYNTKVWTLSTSELAKMITFNEVESTGTPYQWALDPVIAAKEASKTLVPKVGSALGTPPRNARFSTSGGSVTIVPSKDGVGPDIEAFASTLTDTLKKPGADRSVELRSKITPPSLTTQAAKAMGIEERISTFSTTYSTGLPSRVNNIHVLGSALDGKLVAPGDTFSLNGAVGERTAAKGYQEANAIVKGKLVPQMGGGICQVATTLFNAVFMSGFPVVERVNHSFYISHYPTGRDATVSWGGPDLRWKNDTDSWVLVSVAYTDDSITVSLYGTDPGYNVSYTTSPITPGKTFGVIKVNDPTLPVGQTHVVDPGVAGCKITVIRTVKKGGEVIRTDTFTSNYTPKDETINIGTKPVAAAPKPATPAKTPAKKP